MGHSKYNFQQGIVKVPKNSIHGLETLSELVQAEILRLKVPVDRRIVRTTGDVRVTITKHRTENTSELAKILPQGGKNEKVIELSKEAV